MLGAILAFMFKTKVGRILSGALAVGVVVGVLYLQKAYWKHQAVKARQVVQVEKTKVKMKEVELEYAPKINTIKRIGDRSLAQKKEGAVQTPETQAAALADARELADFINRRWGVKK